MIAPPEITTQQAKRDYLRAVQEITGVWQQEVAQTSDVDRANRHIARMWPLTFSPDQQTAIVAQFMARRLSR